MSHRRVGWSLLLMLAVTFTILNSIPWSRSSFGNVVPSEVRAYGWPITYYGKYQQGFVSRAEWLPWDVSPRTDVCFPLGLAIDLLVGALLLAAFAVAWKRTPTARCLPD